MGREQPEAPAAGRRNFAPYQVDELLWIYGTASLQTRRSANEHG